MIKVRSDCMGVFSNTVPLTLSWIGLAILIDIEEVCLCTCAVCMCTCGVHQTRLQLLIEGI